jgi:uncharacterized protein
MSEPAAPEHRVEDDPVTVVFTWEVVPGKEPEFEQWLAQIEATAATFDGHQGVTWLRPDDDSQRYYAVLRFRDSDSLSIWMDSPQRAERISKLEGIAAEADQRLHTTGLETWFSLPRVAVRPPPRWKMAIASFCVVYPCILLFKWLIG